MNPVDKQKIIRSVFAVGATDSANAKLATAMFKGLDRDVIGELAAEPFLRLEAEGATDEYMGPVLNEILRELFPEAVISQG